MKKRVLVAVLLFLVIGSVPQICQAGQLENGRNDHKGFFIGFGVGGGMMNLSGGGTSETKAALLTDVKIGGGITENILILYNGSANYAKISGVNFYTYTFPVAVQWYVWKDLYIRPGVGMSYARASTNVAGINFSTDSKVSIGADFAAGYEFRFGKYFALSPEIVYHYDHIRSSISNANANTFGGQASLLWFF